MTSRRNFVKLAGASVLATTLTATNARSGSIRKSQPSAIQVGIAGYTFLAYQNNIDKIIEVMKTVDVRNISLKNFQLPYETNQQQTDEVIGKFKSAGITVYGLGVIYLKSEKEVDNAFAYAKMAGVKIVIAAPALDLLSYVEKRAKEFNIKVAIHNHGPEDKIFPDIDTIYEKIKMMDPIMGICLDIGHTFRCGHDPAAMFLKFKDRIYDMHIKDVDEPKEKGKNVVNGRGKMDFMNLVKALKKAEYTGMCGLEFEQKGEPAMGLAESVGFFKAVLKCV